MQNVVKHSASRHASVSLNGQIDTINLTVKDFSQRSVGSRTCARAVSQQQRGDKDPDHDEGERDLHRSANRES